MEEYMSKGGNLRTEIQNSREQARSKPNVKPGSVDYTDRDYAHEMFPNVFDPIKQIDDSTSDFSMLENVLGHLDIFPLPQGMAYPKNGSETFGNYVNEIYSSPDLMNLHQAKRRNDPMSADMQERALQKMPEPGYADALKRKFSKGEVSNIQPEPSVDNEPRYPPGRVNNLRKNFLKEGEA